MDAPVKLMPQRTPFRILVSAVLSTRTQDPVTAAAADRLFQIAPDPRALARLSAARIRKLIFPVGFYRTKAKLLPVLSRMLTERWHGQVPRTLAEFLELPGVGRKGANILLSQGFGLPAIAVDTHVQRLSNRLDLVRTSRRPTDTDQHGNCAAVVANPHPRGRLRRSPHLGIAAQPPPRRGFPLWTPPSEAPPNP